MGLALPERARLLRALRPRAGQAPQEAHRSGAPNTRAGTPWWPELQLVVVALLTYSDILALVRKELWAHTTFCELSREPDTVKALRAFVERLAEGFAM